MKKFLFITSLCVGLVLFSGVGFALARPTQGGGGEGVTMQQVNDAIAQAKAEMRAYTDGAVSVLQSEISDLYGQVYGYGYEIRSIWDQIWYLDESNQNQDGSIQNLYAQLNNFNNMLQVTQGDVAALYGIVSGMNGAINNLNFQINNINSTLDWVTTRLYRTPDNQFYPAPDDLQMKVESAYIENGNTLVLNNFKLVDLGGEGAGHPEAAVNADFWFTFDGSPVESNWAFSFYPADGATTITHSLKNTITFEQHVHVTAYAFYAGRTWTFGPLEVKRAS